jgi:hypothetical protein
VPRRGEVSRAPNGQARHHRSPRPVRELWRLDLGPPSRGGPMAGCDLPPQGLDGSQRAGRWSRRVCLRGPLRKRNGLTPLRDQRRTIGPVSGWPPSAATANPLSDSRKSRVLRPACPGPGRRAVNGGTRFPVAALACRGRARCSGDLRLEARRRSGRPVGGPRRLTPELERRILELRAHTPPPTRTETARTVYLPAETRRKVPRTHPRETPSVENGLGGFRLLSAAPEAGGAPLR